MKCLEKDVLLTLIDSTKEEYCSEMDIKNILDRYGHDYYYSRDINDFEVCQRNKNAEEIIKLITEKYDQQKMEEQKQREHLNSVMNEYAVLGLGIKKIVEYFDTDHEHASEETMKKICFGFSSSISKCSAILVWIIRLKRWSRYFMKDWELEYYEELRAWERVEEAKRKLSELEAKLNQKDPFDKIIQIKDSKAGGVIEVPVCNFNFEEVSYGLPTSPTWRDL